MGTGEKSNAIAKLTDISKAVLSLEETVEGHC